MLRAIHQYAQLGQPYLIWVLSYSYYLLSDFIQVIRERLRGDVPKNTSIRDIEHIIKKGLYLKNNVSNYGMLLLLVFA